MFPMSWHPMEQCMWSFGPTSRSFKCSPRGEVGLQGQAWKSKLSVNHLTASKKEILLCDYFDLFFSLQTERSVLMESLEVEASGIYRTVRSCEFMCLCQ